MFCSLLLRVHPSQGVLLVWDQLRESREEAFPPYRDQSVTFWLILMNALPCYQRHLEGNYLSCSCCKLGAARSLWPDRHSHGGVKWESDSTVILGRSEEGLWNSHKNQDVFLAWTAKKENAKRKDNKFNFLFTNFFFFFSEAHTQVTVGDIKICLYWGHVIWKEVIHWAVRLETMRNISPCLEKKVCGGENHHNSLVFP